MKTIINTDKAPAPIGPYSQAVMAGNMLYTSGQIALDPVSMELVNESIEAETRQVMQNLEMILEATGLTFEDVVKSTIFITDMNDFARINSVYGSFFNESTAPARETVQVSVLPKNVNIEISMIALKQ
jgi:2-iminobutanoate/2-iminopropanoate deaminase